MFSILIVAIVILAGCAKEKVGQLSFGNKNIADISHVRLLDGPFKVAQMRDLDYLKSLNSDRLLANFRLTSGLPAKAEPYSGWEERELRGHFTGHYLSGCAMMWAATGDTVMRNRVLYISNELKLCQQANGDGYISAFPREFIHRAETLKPVWAPYYTIHKILNGLIDAYTWCSDSTALDVASGMASWIKTRCDELSESQMQELLDHTEQGGMNDVLYKLSQITGKKVYQDLAERFFQKSYFRPLADYRDSLKGQHVNSFIPNVIGICRGYEITGNIEYRRIAEFFWKTVTETRTFVTGGTSNGEIWGSDNYHIHSELGPSSHETCCTYNMLKLTRQLWQLNQDPAYSDYYERALWNGILPTQDPLTGMSMYYVPMAPGFYKTFGTRENSFWCCTGTGVENFAKAGECIYAVKNDQIYVDQYIASEFKVDSLDFSLRLLTNFPNSHKVEIVLGLDDPKIFGINIRIPGWVASDSEILLNGRALSYISSPSSYLRINRKWKNGDRLTLLLPMNLKLDYLPDAPDTCAITYGPLVLAGALGKGDLNEKKTYGHYGPYEDKPIAVPDLSSAGSPDHWIKRMDQDSLIFKAATIGGDSIKLVPFYQLFDQRYSIYWRIINRNNTPAQ